MKVLEKRSQKPFKIKLEYEISEKPNYWEEHFPYYVGINYRNRPSFNDVLGAHIRQDQIQGVWHLSFTYLHANLREYFFVLINSLYTETLLMDNLNSTNRFY